MLVRVRPGAPSSRRNVVGITAWSLVRCGCRVMTLTFYRLFSICSVGQPGGGGMAGISGGRQSGAFSWWLRTGKLPPIPDTGNLELKFNPWHDPTDGRFTFAGAGSRYGGGSDAVAGVAGRGTSGRAGRTLGLNTPVYTQNATPPKIKVPRAGSSAGGQRSARHDASRTKPRYIARTPPGDQPNAVSEFFGGVGEGLSDVGKGAVEGIHSAFTTSPATTVREAAGGVASMIDAAISAEETPARIQVSRAASAVANASARDVGRFTGSVAGNVALAAAPGATLSRVVALRRLRVARPRRTFDPPQIGWVKETTKSKKPWKAYNDAATNACPGLAPTLMRTMADGSKRPVKFDGVRGDYVIDRKMKVVDAPHARAQLLRQSGVLAEHHLIGLWEVPTAAQKIKALKLFKKMNAANLHVKVVKP